MSKLYMCNRHIEIAEVKAERDAARQALQSDDYVTALAHLQSARKIVQKTRQRDEAYLVCAQARVVWLCVDCMEAAQLFEEAARLLPDGDREARELCLLNAAQMREEDALERSRRPGNE